MVLFKGLRYYKLSLLFFLMKFFSLIIIQITKEYSELIIIFNAFLFQSKNMLESQ